MMPLVLQLGPYPMSALHHAVPNAIVYLPQMGSPTLSLPVWLNAFSGWIATAEVVLGRTLVDADRNHLLLDLLGEEGT